MLGPEIKKALRSKGLMIKYVAEVCQIPYATMKKYTAGAVPMPRCKALLVCREFGLDPKNFGLDGTNKSHSA